MAKNYFLLFLLFTASASFAQVKLGIMGGPQSANITETNSIAGWDSTTGKYYKGKTGLHAGIMVEIPFGAASHFYFQPGLLYSEKGRSFSKIVRTHITDVARGRDTTYFSNATQTLSTKYFDIPLNIGYKIPLNKKRSSNFMISAGPYISMFFNGNLVTSQTNTATYITPFDTTRFNKTSGTTNDLDVGKKDNSYRTFGYGVNARAGFEFGNITLTGFYSQGLDNLYYAAYQATFKHKVFGASLGIWLARTKEPVVIRDRDNDGVTDDKDACPLLPGMAITNGCPDKDGDGIADDKDKCPDVAGVAKLYGCPIPDTDKDGIADAEDKCPQVAGFARYYGCPIPDTDKDGINDEVDKCPKEAGFARYYGCPIPDKDNDGVNDELDKCPSVAGTAANDGCPVVVKEEIKKQVNYAAGNIFFLTNSADLLSKSYKPLQTVADVLKANPELTLTVNGYTDNTGTEAANLSVSAKRALAVKAWLVKNGIDEGRITTNGFGQADPVADNATPEGRTKNRRVELKLK